MSFEQLGLVEPLLKALRDEGYVTPTPIQSKGIPHVLAGLDFLGCAQTGTGKTAAFALPILQRLSARQGHGHSAGRIRALVLTPTRELAAQIWQSFRAYGRYTHIRCAVVYGGVRQRPQEIALHKRPEILVATPGRLLDLMGQRLVGLDAVEVFVLDEADRMLDMGFIHDIRRVVSCLPRERQTLFFSATLPARIRELADWMLHDPVEVRVTPEAPAAETVSHSVYYVDTRNKSALLQHLLADGTITRALVFTRTKHGAERLAQRLSDAAIPADSIHADKTQGARERALADFRRGTTRVLVASDLASRGLDVNEISHVINYDVPSEPRVYVHRIGRTGRAGATGAAWSLCGLEERAYMEQIEKLIRRPIEAVTEHPFAAPPPAALAPMRRVRGRLATRRAAQRAKRIRFGR